MRGLREVRSEKGYDGTFELPIYRTPVDLFFILPGYEGRRRGGMIWKAEQGSQERWESNG